MRGKCQYRLSCWHCDPDTLEFAITALTTLGDEVVLAVYSTEEERDYARYKLENWLVYDVGSYYTMTERK